MESRLGNKIDSLEAVVHQNKKNIETLTSTVTENSAAIDDLRRRAASDDHRLEQRVGDLVRAALDTSAMNNMSIGSCGEVIPTNVSARNPVRSAQQIAMYWTCRKSLRLWPLTGNDLLKAARDFLVTNLEYTAEYASSIIMSARKVVEPRSKIQNEVVVEFSAPAVRDAVKGSGHKLQGKRAGIRMELPHFLKSDFHVLQAISYRLKMANPDMKRSVKFEDEEMGLVLDVQMPGEEWRRIRPSQARAARESDPTLRSGPLDFSSDMLTKALTKKTPLTGANATPIS